MGYMTLVAPCLSCGRVFGSNPNLVPSLRVNGEKQPVCRECIDYINPLREAKGLPRLTYHPDAYEPAEESN